MKDFSVRNFMAFSGPNLYIDKPSMVFKLYVDLKDKPLENYLPIIAEKFPEINNYAPNNIVDLFCFVLKRIISQVEMVLEPASKVIRDEEEWIIAVEKIFDNISKQATFIVSDWFKSITAKEDHFNMDEGLSKLNEFYNEAINELPIEYELLLEAKQRNIDFHFLKDEYSILWGYGKNQVRSRNMKFVTDGILDFELSVDSEQLHCFLTKAGIPTPESAICHYENDLTKEVKRLGFPVVIRPLNTANENWVITGIDNIKILRKKFNKLLAKAAKKEIPFEGIMLQQQFIGNTYRILLVNNKVVSGIQISPAYVLGDGEKTIAELIDDYNRHQNKIHYQIIIDDDISDYLDEQDLTYDSVPEKKKQVFLRKIANLSTGGQAFSITDKIHNENIVLFENIAKFFNLKVLEMDLISTDISKTRGNSTLGIIGIRPDPSLKYHFHPIDKQELNPSVLFEQLIKDPDKELRIPIIAGNNLSDNLIKKIYEELKLIKNDVEFGNISQNGISLNNTFFTNTGQHVSNCSLLFRNPILDIALTNHNHELILKHGTWHYGSDIVILNQARYSEYILMRDMMPGALLVEIKEQSGENHKPALGLTVSIDMKELYSVKLEEGDNEDVIILEVIKPYLEELLFKYG
ncbi:hypothetical protein ACFL6I_12900 [candidate division KSB1 bacterium]